MGIFDFFKKRTKANYLTNREEPSPEQTLFAQTVLKIINPEVEKYGFTHHKTNIKKYSTTIIFRKKKQYIKVSGSNYPTDYPYVYNIILGEGDSENFFEADWNAIALWVLKKHIFPNLKADSYQFPLNPTEVMHSIKHAKDELLKYGQAFLAGDLTLFYEARKALTQKREAYKIHSPNKAGGFDTINESISVEQKKKYS